MTSPKNMRMNFTLIYTRDLMNKASDFGSEDCRFGIDGYVFDAVSKFKRLLVLLIHGNIFITHISTILNFFAVIITMLINKRMLVNS